MNNLVIAYVWGPTLVYLLHRFRFGIFLRHHEVEQLKLQQDGDYFLTSSLIAPLSRNQVEPGNVAVECYQSQYKKFSFRRWSSDLGGDLTTTNNIQLKDKDYTVFINSDSMGKSMQGAGGALILGSIFKAIVNRTQSRFSERNQHPEHWLFSCFREIHDAFISLEGSMFASAVVGLIDNESGLLYYVNLEHPWIALYRDAKASFIEDDMHLRKFGVVENVSQFSIKTFQMLPGDNLFSGTDGRDDLILGYDEHGVREINHNENLFLRNIELAHGELDLLVDSINHSGTITDDLSILKITFQKHISETIATGYSDPEEEKVNNIKENYRDEELRARSMQSPVMARKYCEELVKAGYKEIALKYCLEYSERAPQDASFLYLASYLSKVLFAGTRKKEHLIIAADYAERLYYREKKNIRNLLNLANIYQLFGKKEKTLALLEEIFKIDPGNRKAGVIRDSLRQ